MRSHISKLLIWVLIHSLALPYPIAHAVLNQGTNANAVNASALGSAQPSCENICEQLKQPVDAQFCADHGVPTEAGVMPNTNRALAPAGTCNVTLFEGENCAQVNQLVTLCKLANSQVATQCAAYNQAESVGPLEYTVLGLDMAAAGICGVVCASQWTMVGVGAAPACSAAGCAASVGQIAAIVKSTETPVSKMFQGMMTAAGAYTAFMSSGGYCGFGKRSKNEVEKEWLVLVSMLFVHNAYADGITDSNGYYKPGSYSYGDNTNSGMINPPQQPAAVQPPTMNPEAVKLSNQPMAETLQKYSQQPVSADGVAPTSVNPPPSVDSAAGNYNSHVQEYEKNQQADQQKMACVSAAMFAVLAGLRYKNIDSMKKTKDDACNSVQQLASNAAVAMPALAQTNPLFPTGGSSIRGGGGYGMGGSTGTGVSNITSAAQNGLQCVQAQGLTNCAIGGASTAGAMDANLLGQSGLDRFAAPMAQRMNFDDLKKQIEKGGATAGGVMSGAMGGGSGAAGQFGQGLAKLAQATFDSKVFDSIGMGAGTAYAGGGGGGGGRAPAGDGGMMSALGNLFGGTGQDQAGSQAAAAFAQFGNKQPDIFHAGSPMNIFQIVSDKIQKVNYRVR